MEAPLKVAIYEDMAEDSDLLLQYISQSEIATECEAFSSEEKLLTSFTTEGYDLIFLDIYMGEIQQGVNVAAKIREMDTRITMAFTTSSKEHALESYRLKAYAYLEKPVCPEDVHEVLEHALNKRRNTPTVKLLIEGTYRDIPLDSILYFENQNHAVMVNTLNDTLRTSQTIKLNDIEAMLPDTFIRCHHSYIANLRYVREMNRELKIFIMKNGDKVYIRRQDIKKSVRAYEDYLLNTARETKYEA